MRIVQLTAGTGSFYCGTCLRDAALVQALRALGHDALLAPLYLPLVLEDGLDATPVHMGGINAYLAHLSRWRLPGFAQDWLDSPRILGWAARRAEMTQAHALGKMTVAMLRGEEGSQRTEIEKLVDWLGTLERPDVFMLSNALLLGLARPLARAFGVPILCSLQGEAPFLDALGEPHRSLAWSLVRERARDARHFLAVSRYTGELMRARLALPAERVEVIPNGIDLCAYRPAKRSGAPTIGFLARLCRDKGLDTLVQAFLLLKQRPEFGDLRLLAAGTTLAQDRPHLRELERTLKRAGLAHAYEFHANVTFEHKLAVFEQSSVFSVPATYGESFGLYLLEAWAAGLAVVQPAHAAFPELLEATGGGLLVRPDDPGALAEGLASLLLDPERARALGAAGRESVRAHYTSERMARDVERACRMACARATLAAR